jgi:outer membrane protein TolC
MKKTLIFIFFPLIQFLVQSCKMINTNVAINNQKIPSYFVDSQKVDSFVMPHWHEFIKDKYLLSILDSAVANNQDIHSAIQRIEVAQAGFRQAKSALFPTVGVNLGSSLRKFGLYTMDGAGNISTEITPGKIVPIHLPDYYLGVSSSWEVDLWGKLRSLKKHAYSNFLQSKEAYNIVVSGVISELSVAYLRLISFDSKLNFIDSMLVRQNSAIQVIQEQKIAGRVNELAVQQFIAQVKEMEVLRNELVLEIQKTENLINFLCGRFPQPINRSGYLKSEFIAKISSSGIPSQLLNNRPDIKYAYLELEKNKCLLFAAKANFFPSFTINSNVSFQAFNPKFLIETPTSLAYQLLGNITSPLINRVAIKAEFNRAKASQIETMYQYQKTIIHGYTEVLNDLLTIKNLNSNLKLREERFNAISKATEASVELFRSSKVNYFEMLYLKQAEIDAQLELINNFLELNIAEIKLFKSLGGFQQ